MSIISTTLDSSKHYIDLKETNKQQQQQNSDYWHLYFLYTLESYGYPFKLINRSFLTFNFLKLSL